jgi:hypothetical protein
LTLSRFAGIIFSQFVFVVNNDLKKLKKGFMQAVIGIITCLALTIIINYLAQKGIIPRESVTIWGIISLLINIFTMNSFGSVGIVYTIGWLAGSLLFISIMSEQDIVINIVIPVILLIVRCFRRVKKLA